jgi:hypothetical protein
MIKYILVITLLLGIALALLAIKHLITKNGRFHISHVSSNREMRRKGIGCAQSQDREARKQRQWKVKENNRTK